MTTPCPHCGTRHPADRGDLGIDSSAEFLCACGGVACDACSAECGPCGRRVHESCLTAYGLETLCPVCMAAEVEAADAAMEEKSCLAV